MSIPIPGLPRVRRKRTPRDGPASNRLTIVVGVGTSGARLQQLLWQREPSFRDASIALDAEIPASELARNENLVATPDQGLDAYRAKVVRIPLIRDDPWIPTLRLPHDSERGAGACRVLGTIKGAVVLDAFRQKLNRILRRRLSRLDTQERPIVAINLVAASCGGFGSGLVVALTLIIRNEVRKVAPQARCQVGLHLVLSSLYEASIADGRVREKVLANDYATFLEINHAQDPRNVARMADLLGCEPPAAPTFDRVVPYHVSDESGKTAPLDGILAERVLPNILAGDNEGLATRLREVASNSLALQHGGGEPGPHPLVSPSQAAASRIPSQFGESWALGETWSELDGLLAKPSAARLRVFEGPAKTALRIEGHRAEIARACSEPLNGALIHASSLRKHAPLEAHSVLTETYDRYHSAIKTTVEARCRTVLENCEAVATPRMLDELVDMLAENGATIGDVILSLRGLRKEVDDFGARVEKEAEKAAATVKARQRDYGDAMQRLLTKPWLAGRVKEQAAEGLNRLINAENVVQQHRTLLRVARLTSQALAGVEAEVVLVHREATRSLGTLKARRREAREIATAQSPTITSIIRPDEFDEAIARLDRGIRGVNEALPRLDVRALLRAGQVGVSGQIESAVERRIEAFNAYYESTLVDVTGAARLLKLAFSVPVWIESTLRSLACCSPVSLAASAEAEPQTVIAACGDDLEAVRQLLRRNPLLALVDAVAGTDPRMIVLHRRVEGLTIEAIPTYGDAMRAARAFPKPAPGLTAWQSLASSGFMLGAYEQECLVPDEWRVAQALQADRAVAHERFAPNGEAH